jgi:hypothetical protein
MDEPVVGRETLEAKRDTDAIRRRRTKIAVEHGLLGLGHQAIHPWSGSFGCLVSVTTRLQCGRMAIV